MTSPIYNTIGIGYNNTRRADPYIAGRMLANLQPATGGTYLDIGCGTGNYLQVFTQQGLHFYGIDPSETMLVVAKEKCPGTTFIQGKAESIPLADGFFDGATCMFTLHHWDDMQKGLAEVNRVLKPGARLVILSFTPKQMYGYWLCHYFPEMMRRSALLTPDIEVMTEILNNAGFTTVNTENYFIHEGLEDHFLYSNKYHPEQYLNPELRKGISSFAAFSTPAEVAQGLKMLEADILSGKVNDIIKRYENENGDYIFFIATK